MGGFLGRNKEGASGFWAVLDLDNYPRGQSFSIEESLELMDQLRSFLEFDRYSSKLSILFFGFLFCKDSFRISNGKNQEIGNNGSKVDSKEEYYIQ